MDFKRWFFTDDTPRWKRTASVFLLVATLGALVAVVWALSAE